MDRYGTDGCIARVNFPAPALVSLINSESETFDQMLALAGESLDELVRIAPLLETGRRIPRRSFRCVAETRRNSTDRALRDQMRAARQFRDR